MKKLLYILLLTACTVSYSQTDTLHIRKQLQQADENLYRNPAISLNYSLQALESSKKIFYLKGASDALHKIGIVYDITGKYDSALVYFQSLYNLGNKTQDSIVMATALNSRGLVLWNKGKLTDALSLFYSAYLIFDKKNNVLGKAKSSNNISLVSLDLEKPREGLKAAHIAIDNFKLSDQPEKIGAPITNIGLFYVMLNQYDTAEIFLKQAIDIKNKLGDNYGLGISYNSLGYLYTKKGQVKKSVEAYQKAIEYKKIVGDRYGYISSSYNVAEGYEKMGELDKSYKILSEILPEAQSLKSNRILYRIYHGLFLYHTNKGNYKQALDYHLAHINLKDSVKGNELKEEIEEMRTKYESEVKESENKLLREKNRVQELEKKEAVQRDKVKTISLISSGLLLVLILFLGYLFYHRYKQKQEIRLKEEVQQAEEKERGRIARDLHDHVGAHLAFIIQRLHHSSSAEKEDLSNSATNALNTLRETVWALNKNNVSTDEFSDRLKTFIKNIQGGFPQFNIEFEENITKPYRLSPGTALNLFRLCQEAISNAFRHSEGSIIHIHIESSDETVIGIKVSDNGKGFDPQRDAKKDHYGLENMQHRAKEAGAEYNLQSSPETGTIIHIEKRNV